MENLLNFNLINPPLELCLGFIFIIVWDLFWRGKALWKAAKNKQKKWFVALLIINSVSILPITYYFFFSKKRNKQSSKT